MPVSQPTSAKNGTGTWDGIEIGHLTDISFNDTQELDVYASSNTGGQRSRIAGHQDSTGQFVMIVDPATVTGLVRGNTGVLVLKDTTGSTVFNGNAIIGDVERSIPIDDGTRLVWTVTWGQKPEGSS